MHIHTYIIIQHTMHIAHKQLYRYPPVATFFVLRNDAFGLAASLSANSGVSVCTCKGGGVNVVREIIFI